MASPADQTFAGGLQGGFLVQNNNSLTGSIAFSIALPQPSPSPAIVCSNGSATVTGTVNGQNVTFTAAAGTQTFTFAGTVSLDSSSLAGTYSSTAGTASDGTACGTVQSGLTWSATFVPPLTGPIQGNFHSTGGVAGLNNQDFPLAGVINQALNNNGSSAAVTGNLGFVNPATSINNYPCITTAVVTGQISGSTVVLQLNGTDGSNLGQIGGILAGHSVTFDRVSGGNVVHDLAGGGYAVNTPACSGSSLTNAGDSGNICLGVGTSACTQPITLTPAAVAFPAQTVGSTVKQTITLTNNTNSTLNGLALALTNPPGSAANFAAVGDTCDLPGSSFGSPFQLLPGVSCAIQVAFTPQQSAALSATLAVTSPVSTDSDTSFAVPITGIGVPANR